MCVGVWVRGGCACVTQVADIINDMQLAGDKGQKLLLFNQVRLPAFPPACLACHARIPKPAVFQVEELVVRKSPTLLDSFFDEILQFHLDGSADVRKQLVAFIEAAVYVHVPAMRIWKGPLGVLTRSTMFCRPADKWTAASSRVR